MSKLLLVIDNFGSGGAQRQFVSLAIGLKNKGYNLDIFNYYPEFDFFRPELEKNDINIYQLNKKKNNSLDIVIYIWKMINRNNYNVIISFLTVPNLYIELATLCNKRVKVIVSERASRFADRNRLLAFTTRLFHALADVIVTNSYDHANWLRRHFWLRKKTVTIYNGFHIKKYLKKTIPNNEVLKIISIGRITPDKNILNLIKALIILKNKYNIKPILNWAGRIDNKNLIYYKKLCNYIKKYLDNNQWVWMGEIKNISEQICKHDILIHPSNHEGLPNVICEAFSLGIPVLASNVCEHPILVENGNRGYLFDKNNPMEIAQSIKKYINLNELEKRDFSSNSYRFACEYLNMNKMISSFEKLIND